MVGKRSTWSKCTLAELLAAITEHCFGEGLAAAEELARRAAAGAKAQQRVAELHAVLGELQGLAGDAKHTYLNDRGSDRADLLVPILEHMFSLALEARADAPAEEPARSGPKAGKRGRTSDG